MQIAKDDAVEVEAKVTVEAEVEAAILSTIAVIASVKEIAVFMKEVNSQ